LVALIDVHAPLGLVGWAGNADTQKKTLRPDAGKTDNEVFQTLAKKASEEMKDPVQTNYKAKVGDYPVSGDILAWQYESSQNKCLTFLIEVGSLEFNFRPDNPEEYAKGVLPGMLFMMFAAADVDFKLKPKMK
jgi:hypothetical protein